jgi:lysophospholipase L1-like esterase
MTGPGIARSARRWTSFVALGDSFTEGLMDEVGSDGRHRGWADRVADELALQVPRLEYANLAIRGRLVQQVATEQVPIAVGMRPALVSFAAGVNDALRRSFDLDAASTSVERSVRSLRECGSDVLLFAFGDPSRRSALMGLVQGRVWAYDQALRAIAVHYGCYLVDFWGVAAFDEDRYWDDDRLHLSPEGHALAAQAALEALGLRSDAWRTPLPLSRPGPVHRLASHGNWARAHLAPWIVRRIKGRSSGDAIHPKEPHLIAWPRGGSDGP